jgi:DnaJ family protein C protein 28
MSDSGKSRKRPARDWASAVDRAIRDAQERGDFDNLSGTGKPIRWDDEHVPSEWRMASRILKNAGYAPSWIEDDKWIRHERKALREMFHSFVAWYQRELSAAAALPEPDAASGRTTLADAREQRIAAYRERAAKLNKRIDGFNLTVPVSRLQWHRVPIDTEIERFRQQLEDVARAIGEDG